MTSAQHRRIKALFVELRACPAPEREGRLADLWATEPSVAAELLSLLEVDAASEVLEQPAFGEGAGLSIVAAEYLSRSTCEALLSLPGVELRGLQGAGATAIVYSAVLREGNPWCLRPGTRVAIKALRPSGDGLGDHSCLAAEALALGRLDHPHVVQLLGSSGLQVEQVVQPFLLLEYVEGLELLDHLREQAPGLEDRVRLILPLVDAVQHCHGQQVLHGDLKAQNVMVDLLGRVRLLDFGSARSFHHEASQGLDSSTGDVAQGPGSLGSLAYMAPEQLDRFQGPTHETELYAMGVLLYRVFSDRPPVDVSGLSLEDAARKLARARPEPLSRWIPEASGPLEAIVDACLERNPKRRPASMGALAADLRAWLDHEPVVAQPIGRLRRTLRYASKHRGPVAAVGAVVLALLVGVVATSVALVHLSAARRSERTSAEHALAVNDHLVALLDRVGSGQDWQESFERAAEALSLSTTLPPDSRAQLASAYGNALWSAGSLPASQEMFRLEIQLREGFEVQPSRSYWRARLQELGVAGYLGQQGQLEPLLQELVVQMKEAGAESELFADAHVQLAIANFDLRNFSAVRDSLATAESYLEEVSDPFASKLIRIKILHQGGRSEAALGHSERAEELYRECLALAERFGLQQHPTALTAQMGLGVLLVNAQRRVEARPLLRGSLEGHRKRYGAGHVRSLQALHNLGWLEVNSDQASIGVELLREALAGREGALGRSHSSTLNTRLVLARGLAAQGQPDAAELEFRTALTGVRESRGPEHVSTAYFEMIFASFLQAQGRGLEGYEALQRAMLVFSRTPEGRTDTRRRQAADQLAALCAELERPVEARRWRGPLID